MSGVINGEMIQLARESRGLTQTDLSRATSISQASISKFERGELCLSEGQLENISVALGYPPKFFRRSDPLFGLGISGIFHRSRKSLPVLVVKKIPAEMNIRVVELDRLLQGVQLHCENEFCELDVQDFEGDAEHIAELVRAKWCLPLGPIKSVIGVIESAGGVVIKSDFETRKIDALSHWMPGRPPVFFVNRDVPADRLRFTLAHEIGHITMHRIPTPNIEQEADQFASAFLMPREEIISELSPFSLERAMRLKSKWKVSIAALIMRAHQLGVISDSMKRKFFTKMSAAGYRIEEPVVLQGEEPIIVRRLIEIYRKDFGYQVQDIAGLLCLNEDEFCARYLGSSLRVRKFIDNSQRALGSDREQLVD
jgi:Zn-dependent peptidase ImmA (M78 family)/transcriptional regulator with XRE-family HTH domain